MKEQLKELFNLSRRERNGSILLAALILLFTLINFVLPSILSNNQERLVPTHALYDEIAQQPASQDSANMNEVPLNLVEEIYTPKRSLFPFDPNTITTADWQNLGLSEKQAMVIRRYLDRGGKFRTKSDLRKMYVISDQLFAHLEPYINIPAEDVSKKHSSNQQYQLPDIRTNNPLWLGKTMGKIELNSADTSDLKKLKGIGSSLARRIVTYREKLGGFTHVDQLLEVYFLSPEIIDTLRPLLVVDSTLIHKIHINQVSTELLARHPYISASQSKALIAFREKHGPFKNQRELLKCVLMDEVTVNKLAPYLIY